MTLPNPHELSVTTVPAENVGTLPVEAGRRDGLNRTPGPRFLWAQIGRPGHPYACRCYGE